MRTAKIRPDLRLGCGLGTFFTPVSIALWERENSPKERYFSLSHNAMLACAMFLR